MACDLLYTLLFDFVYRLYRDRNVKISSVGATRGERQLPIDYRNDLNTSTFQCEAWFGNQQTTWSFRLNFQISFQFFKCSIASLFLKIRKKIHPNEFQRSKFLQLRSFSPRLYRFPKFQLRSNRRASRFSDKLPKRTLDTLEQNFQP